MLRRFLLATGLLGGAALLTAEAAEAPDREAAVTIDNFTFSPTAIAVGVGTRVTWTNRDDIPHTVTSGDDAATLRSPPLDTGESYSVTFRTPGTFSYFCSLHPHMQGTVVVR